MLGGFLATRSIGKLGSRGSASAPPRPTPTIVFSRLGRARAACAGAGGSAGTTSTRATGAAGGGEFGAVVPAFAAGDEAAMPTPTDRVVIQYRGSLLDETEFDSTYTRGQPASFQVTGVIKGLQEGLALMRPGAKWRIFIPPELAYGDQPAGNIPPGSLLIFDVELLSVAAPAPRPPGASPPH